MMRPPGTQRPPLKAALGILVLSSVLVFVFVPSAPVRAELGGSVELQASVRPGPECTLSTPWVESGTCEATVPLLGFLAALDFTLEVQDLRLDGHAHLGGTGLEDVVLRWPVELGVGAGAGGLALGGSAVFAQPFGLLTLSDGREIAGCYEAGAGAEGCATLWVRQELLVRASGAGSRMSARALALVEDVAFPRAGATKPPGETYGPGDQRFGFGGELALTARPAEGPTVSLTGNFCLEGGPRQLKHHRPEPRVSAACAPTLELLRFVSEEIAIRDLTVLPGLRVDATIACVGEAGCEFASLLALSPALVFSTAEVEGRWQGPPGPGELKGVTLKAGGGPLSLRIRLDGTLGFRELVAVVEGPPGRVRLRTRATGFSELVFTLTRSAGDVRFSSELTLSGTGLLAFRSWELEASTALGAWGLEAEALFSPAGLDELAGGVRFSF